MENIIKMRLDDFSSHGGTVTCETTEGAMEHSTYSMLGLEAPPNNGIAKKVVWTISDEQRILYCVLQLHPKQWGVCVVVGVVETLTGICKMLDGQFFPLASLVSDAAVPSLLSWMDSRLIHGFG